LIVPLFGAVGEVGKVRKNEEQKGKKGLSRWREATG
jgi:hypothetical protein